VSPPDLSRASLIARLHSKDLSFSSLLLWKTDVVISNAGLEARATHSVWRPIRLFFSPQN
jgi:hypothetical protein